jgi:hypothetical protein
MKRPAFALRLLLLVALAALPSAASAAQGKSDKGYNALAEFSVNPTGCRKTYATVSVNETIVHTPPGPPHSAVTVELVYNVRSTCQDPGDFLFYYEIHTEGPVTVPEDDFVINSGLQWATLDTTLPVFDEECGCGFNLGVKVAWTATKLASPHSRSAVATLEVSEQYLSPLYITNPLTSSVSATLSKVP